MERWSADEPVSAWREPFSRRARRWTRRNRTAVALIAETLVACDRRSGRLPCTPDPGQRRSQVGQPRPGDGQPARRRRQPQPRARERAERARFDLALDAIKTFHSTVSEELLLNEAQFAAIADQAPQGRDRILRAARGHAPGQPDNRSRAALGKAYQDIGELTARIGSQSEAIRRSSGDWSYDWP